MTKLRSLMILSTSLLGLTCLPSSANWFEIPKLGSMACAGKIPCYDDPNTCLTQAVYDRCIKNCVLNKKDLQKAQEAAAKLRSCPPEMMGNSQFADEIQKSNLFGNAQEAPQEEMNTESSQGMPETMPEEVPQPEAMPQSDGHQNTQDHEAEGTPEGTPDIMPDENPMNSGDMPALNSQHPDADDQMGMIEQQSPQPDTQTGPHITNPLSENMSPGMGGEMNEHMPYMSSNFIQLPDENTSGEAEVEVNWGNDGWGDQSSTSQNQDLIAPTDYTDEGLNNEDKDDLNFRDIFNTTMIGGLINQN